MTRKFDLTSIGEALLRLSPPDFQPLRSTRSLDLAVAGSQCNIAVNCGRLGLKSRFLTKLPDSPLGELVLRHCRVCGADTAAIPLVPGGKMGATYVEFGLAPRAPKVVYDRAGSTASTIQPGDFDWDALAAESTVLYTDGIFPGLSAGCRAAAEEFLAAGRRHGCLGSFDMNFRAHLWTPEEAEACWRRLLPHIDILVTNPGVSEQVFHWHGSDRELMQRYHQEFGCRVVCSTRRGMDGLQRGSWTSAALLDGREWVESKPKSFDILDRYGTGDAWFSGFLCGYLTGGDLAYSLDLGNAVCALAHTVFGDAIDFPRADAEAILHDVELRLKR